MTPLGLIISVVEKAPKELLRDPSASAPDFRNLAEKMEHSARKLRTLAECRLEVVHAKRVRTVRRASA